MEADPEKIAQAGQELADNKKAFTTDKEDAWAAFTNLLNYYSFLNTSFLDEHPLTPFVPHPDYDVGGTGGRVYDFETLYSGGIVPIKDAAIGEHIVNPEPTKVSEGPQIIIMKGKPEYVIDLDAHHIRNIVYINVTIVYNGGPVILENVSFIKCQFRLAPSTNCLSLGRTIFASTRVTFKTVG